MGVPRRQSWPTSCSGRTDGCGRVISAETRKRYLRLRTQGSTQKDAAREVGVSAKWASNFERGIAGPRRGWTPTESEIAALRHVQMLSEEDVAGLRAVRDISPVVKDGKDYAREKERAGLPTPLAFDELCVEAKRGWEDFEFFRRFYLGHVSTPWQVETAYTLIELLATGQKEYVVENCPPGVGKTTLIHDIACWATVRDRRLRGLIGSRVETNARRMLSRIKRSLERPTPAKAPTEAIDMGIAVDAVASLAQHYGLFRPAVKGDIWRADEFIVAQLDDIPIEEKEPTWSSYGLDSGVLSNRFNLIFWDDLIDGKGNRSANSREELVAKWDEELENRLEPGGLLVILGQRLHREDLYATLRDRKQVDDDGNETVPMYHHIVYPAHDESRCAEVHKPAQEPKPWPEGCLLDPYRLPWSECVKLRTKRHIWPVVYQQTDGDPNASFVNPIWITGGTGPDGTNHPGCWDKDRKMAELPRLEGRTLSIATVDPSPTKYWAIQWWVYHPASEFRFLMDLERKKMEAPDFFDFNPTTQAFHGLLVDWQERSAALGWPISHWIVERNAAQRFMLQQTSLKQYATKMGFALLPHETTMNKSDPNFGVQSIAPHYAFGRIRLPGRFDDPGRTKALRLVDELLRWPEGSTDDCVMAHWFLEWNLPKLTAPDRRNMPKPGRPTWMKTQVAV